jgi:hypothetical protein
MPLPALSLLGFLSEKAALEYLQRFCVLPDPSPEARRRLWAEARQRRGPALARAGQPAVRPLPAECLAYTQEVLARPGSREALLGVQGRDWDFALVEIGPLLAMQVHVLPARVAARLEEIKDPSNLLEVTRACLPQAPSPVRLDFFSHSSGIVIKAHDTFNASIGRRGVFQDAGLPPRYGIEIKRDLPLVQVVRYRGRCYLRSGYHRACGLMEQMRLRGLTSPAQIPCVLREAAEFGQTGATANGLTFTEDVFQSDNPPTCGHYTEERACPVQLRKASKVITVLWSEGTIFEE